MTNKTTEQLIQEKGITAPRVTPEELKANIASIHFFTAGQAIKATEPDDYVYFTAEPHLRMLTFCVLVLKNGFTVTGESACASPENFDVEVGRKTALQNAEQKIWPLMGYHLKQKLSEGV